MSGLSLVHLDSDYIKAHSRVLNDVIGKLAGSIINLHLDVTPISVIRHMSTLQFPRLQDISIEAIVEGSHDVEEG